MLYSGKDYAYVRFYDRDFNLVKEISEFSSLIYTERAENIGEFEIHLREKDIDISTFGYYMKVGQDKTLSGIIEYEYWNGDGYDQENSDDYTLKGYSLMGLLQRRIIIPPSSSEDGYLRYVDTPIEDIIVDLIISQCITPENSDRKMKDLHVTASRGRGEKITVEFRNDNLMDVLNDLISKTNLFFQAELNVIDKNIEIKILEGKDRTQGTDKYTISKKYDRVVEESFEHSILGTANYAYVYGEGDGKYRTLYPVYRDIHDNKIYSDDKGIIYNPELANPEEDKNAISTLNNPDPLGILPTGMDRREVYVDAKNIANELDDDNDNTGENDEQKASRLRTNTFNALMSEGTTKLNELRESANLEYVATPDKYGVEYNLGDKLLYSWDEVGLKGNTQEGKVTEVTHTWEEGQYNVSVITGHTKSTILSAIATAQDDATVERTGLTAKFHAIEADFANIDDIIADQINSIKITTDMLEAGIITADLLQVDSIEKKHIKDDAVDSDKIANGGVNGENIADDSIEGDHVLFDSLTGDHIQHESLIGGHLYPSSVTGDRLVDGTLTGAKLVNNSITETKIADDSISTPKLQANSVTSNEITSNAITSAKISAGAVTTEKIHSNSISSDHLIAGCVIADKIASNAITTAKISANAITTAKLATDAIKSTNYSSNSSSQYTNSGSYFNLSNGVIQSPYFYSNSVSAGVKGDLDLESGNSITFYNGNGTINSSIYATSTGDLNLSANYGMSLSTTGNISLSATSTVTVAGTTYTYIGNNSTSGGTYLRNRNVYYMHGKSSTYWGSTSTSILELAYPIGAVYISTKSTNPGNIFGGTWQQIAKGRTLIGQGTGDFGKTYSNGSSGGAETHEHGQTTRGQKSYAQGYSGLMYTDGSTTVANNTYATASSSSMMPYLVVYIWERTA